MKRHGWWLLPAVVIVGLDQLSKALAAHWLAGGTVVPVIPMVDFALAYNTGAAFSFLSDAGGWQRWFFALLSAAVSAVIAVWLARLDRRERLTGAGLSLILGGAVGNLIDRVIHGYVIDFIDFHYAAAGCLPLFHGPVHGACHFPTFNIADSAISIGAALLLAGSLRSQPAGDA